MTLYLPGCFPWASWPWMGQAPKWKGMQRRQRTGHFVRAESTHSQAHCALRCWLTPGPALAVRAEALGHCIGHVSPSHGIGRRPWNGTLACSRASPAGLASSPVPWQLYGARLSIVPREEVLGSALCLPAQGSRRTAPSSVLGPIWITGRTGRRHWVLPGKETCSGWEGEQLASGRQDCGII